MYNDIRTATSHTRKHLVPDHTSDLDHDLGYQSHSQNWFG